MAYIFRGVNFSCTNCENFQGCVEYSLEDGNTCNDFIPIVINEEE